MGKSTIKLSRLIFCNLTIQTIFPVALLLLLLGLPHELYAVQPLALNLPPSFTKLEPLVLDPRETDWLKIHSTLRVGIPLSNNEPIDISSDRNRYIGISADYLSLLSQRLGISLDIVGFSDRVQAIEALERGDVDILVSANDFEKNREGIMLSNTYIPDRSVLVAHGNRTDLTNGLSGKKIAVLSQYVSKYTLKNTYPNSEFIFYTDLNSALEALSQREVDVFIGNELVVRSYNRVHPALNLHIISASALPLNGFSFATNARGPLLNSMINRALETIDDSLQREILARWTFGLGSLVTGHFIELSAKERAWIEKHPKVTVAATLYPPYTYQEPDGDWIGLNIDLLSSISRMTGLQFEIKESSSISDVISLLKTGKADMTTTLEDSAERQRYLDFTTPYGRQGWVLIVRKNSPPITSLNDLGGKIVALPHGHVFASRIHNKFPQIKLILVDSYNDARLLVIKGQADATIDSEFGAYFAVQNDGSGLLKIGHKLTDESASDLFAVSDRYPELLSILNKSLDALPENELRTIQTRWLGAITLPRPFWQNIPPWFYWTIFVVTLLIAISAIWSSRLKLQIRRRITAEKALLDQLAFRQALLDGLPNPIYVCNLHRQLIACNTRFEESMLIQFEQIQGAYFTDIYPLSKISAKAMDNDFSITLKSQKAVFSDRQLAVEDRLIDTYQWTVPFFDAEGQLGGVLGGWIDITDRKKLELDLFNAREIAEQSNEKKSVFLATLSHEIRTPLNAIIGLLELEHAQLLAAGQQPSDNLTIVHQAAKELISLIGDTLDIAKIESGKMQLALTITSLRPFFDDIFQLFVKVAEEKGLVFTLSFSDEVDGNYWLDPLRLRQILHNLLSNSLKFTEEGGVSLSVAPEISTTKSNNICISIRDTGIGINKEQQTQLFKPFAQACKETVTDYGGSGLGLSICKQLVELMGGEITLESELGKGTLVRIVLPLDKTSPLPPKTELYSSPFAVERSLRILIVDDVSANRLVLTQQLQFLGHQVIAEQTAKGALKQWYEHIFDLVITDCNMPEMTGYELASTIRDIEESRQLKACPIIGCTANAMSDEEQRCKNAGMDLLLVKPVILDQLSEALTTLISPKSFDIETLRNMTQANDAILQKMLLELYRNLETEGEMLHQIATDKDWEGLKASLHRLKGIACLIDAVPLARACASLDTTTNYPSFENWGDDLAALDLAISQVHADIAFYLA